MGLVLEIFGNKVLDKIKVLKNSLLFSIFAFETHHHGVTEAYCQALSLTSVLYIAKEIYCHEAK